jgi:hypothetical protein
MVAANFDHEMQTTTTVTHIQRLQNHFYLVLSALKHMNQQITIFLPTKKWGTPT